MTFTKFPSRLILAWIVLAIAMVLLTLSVTFAQSVSIIKKANGEVKFKYKNSDRSNRQDIDTTFTAKNDDDYLKIMKGINERYNLNLSIANEDVNPKKKKRGDEKNGYSFQYNIQKKFDDEKSQVDSTIREEEKNINIEFSHSFNDIDSLFSKLEASLSNFNFDLNIEGDRNIDMKIHSKIKPPSPPASPSASSVPPPPEIRKERVEIRIDKNGKDTRIINDESTNDFSIPDSLDNEDHVIVFGKEGELAPELEKVIQNKNGKQIFIYKRKK